MKRGENYQVTPGCSSQSTHQAFLREKKLMENMVLKGKNVNANESPDVFMEKKILGLHEKWECDFQNE